MPPGHSNTHQMRLRAIHSLPGTPISEAGRRIGLLGGSFNPPHEGHLHLAQQLYKRLDLDAVWWLVTPGNPLKSNDTLPSVEVRMDAVRRLVGRHPAMHVTAPEVWLDTAYTAELLDWLVTHYPKTHFVWLMGADNLIHFHHWEQWQHILSLMPVAVGERGRVATMPALNSPAAHYVAKWGGKWTGERGVFSPNSGNDVRPSLMVVSMPRHPASSTEIRKKLEKKADSGHNERV